MNETTNFKLIWPLVFIITASFYILIIINLPFNQLNSTIFLLGLVAFWSRLPGVGIPTPLYILYFADIIDFFAVLIVINVDPWTGALFSLWINLLSRLCGFWPRWDGVLKDTACQFIACLVVPYIYVATGGNIEATLGGYTFVRAMLFFPFHFIPDGTPLIEFIIYEMIGASTAMIIVNIIYARFFGSLFTALIQQGVQFNWYLFIFVTITIWLVKRKLFGKSKSIIVKKIITKVIKKSKHKQKEKLEQFTEKREIEEIKNIKKLITYNNKAL